jgi:hypothetical protein
LTNTSFSLLSSIMRIQYFLSILLAGFILSGCPNGNERALSKVKTNRMNFPDPAKRTHDGISFDLSELFTDSYYSDYVLQKTATTKAIMEMNVHFSVETFGEYDIKKFRFISQSEEPDLELVHKYYISKRLQSLEEYSTSIRKKVPEKVGFPGYVQVIEGGSTYDSQLSTYMTASVKIDEKIFVFQLIGPSKHMGYFYDDFLGILRSIEK